MFRILFYFICFRFLQKLSTLNEELQILDLKDMQRAPQSKEVRMALIQAAKIVTALKLTMTGEVSQNFGFEILQECHDHLKSLEIVLPKYAKVPFQKTLMSFILQLNLHSLIMFGSFACVTTLNPVQKEATLVALKCAGEAKARNNFLKTLVHTNSDTLAYLDFGEDPLPDTLSSASSCTNLRAVIVQTFKQLQFFSNLNDNVQVVVRGCPQENVEDAVDFILRAPEGSILRSLSFLGIFANGKNRDRMDLLLMAVASTCQNLTALKLIGWCGSSDIVSVLRGMPQLTRLSMQHCMDMQECLLDELSTEEILPNLRGFVIESTSWHGLSEGQLLEKLQRISSARPKLFLWTRGTTSSHC